MGKRRLFYLRLGLVLGGALLPFLVLEAWMRVRAYRADLAERLAWAETRNKDLKVPKNEEALFFQLVQLSRNPNIVYELRPNLDVTFGGVRVETDRRGWRKLPKLPAPATGSQLPEVRIVGIGDSFMFGWSVAAQNTYLARLQHELHRRHPQVRWQVTNTAVPGYNTVMEVATLKTKALTLEPHLVVVGFVGNDLDLPHFIHEAGDYWSCTRSFLFEHLARAFAGTRRTAAQPLVAASGLFDQNRDPEDLPAAYRHLVGRAPFAAALRQLKLLGQKHGFQILVVAHTRAPEYLRDTCTHLRLPLVECGPGLERFMKEHGIQQYQGSALTISETDPHPSALGHRLIAASIQKHLADTGVIEQLLPLPAIGR